MANMTKVMTKEEVKESSTIDLALRMDFLLSVHEDEMEEGEGISMVVCNELVEIDKELKERLYAVLARGRRQQ